MTESGPWDDAAFPEQKGEDRLRRLRRARTHKSWRELSEPGTLRALPALLGAVCFFGAAALICVDNGHLVFLPVVAVSTVAGAWYLFRAVMVIVWWLRKRR